MKVITVGRHPLLEDLKRQYDRARAGVESFDSFSFLPENISCDEIVILTSPDSPDAAGGDMTALSGLKALASRVKPSPDRTVVHLLLQSQVTLRMLQMTGFSPEVEAVFEVWPFTMEEAWARKLLVRFPGLDPSPWPPLDRVPIGPGSRRKVHLVISGFDAQAEAVAFQAALSAHYPNYRPSDKVPLRTRITVIDEDVRSRRDAFISRYQQLFDNSYYRTIIPADGSSEFHRPVYSGQRKDFVDVEWEFVEGRTDHPVIRKKISGWAVDPDRLLTLLFSGGNDTANLDRALSLPEEVYSNSIPVFVRTLGDGWAEALGRNPRYASVHTFGMPFTGYDVSLPLVRMARMLNYFYSCSLAGEGVPTSIPRDRVSRTWREVSSFRMRLSNVFNVMCFSSKMRSLGHEDDRIDRFYALTREEVVSLSETEHNRWSVERLLMGSRPCTDAEKEEIRSSIAAVISARKAGEALPEDLKRTYKQRNVHFDLCSYDELEADATGRDVREYDYDLTAAIPLIMKCYFDEYGNG